MGGSPEIEAEAAIVELAEVVHHELPIGVKIPCPLQEGQKVAVAVVDDLLDTERSFGKLTEEIVKNEE
jgi:hypothetical protein